MCINSANLLGSLQGQREYSVTERRSGTHSLQQDLQKLVPAALNAWD